MTVQNIEEVVDDSWCYTKIRVWYIDDWSRYLVFTLESVIEAFHGVCFARTCLPVGEYSAVIPFSDTIEQVFDLRLAIDVFLA